MQSASIIMTSHQDTLSKMMDVVANNVSNASTTGFRRQVSLAETVPVRPTRGIITRSDPLLFALPAGSYNDVTQGVIKPTGNPLDVAIEGKGLFSIQAPDGGVRYSRSGAFSMNSQGQIISASGGLLLGDGNQPIALPENATDINIASDGTVTARAGAERTLTQVGRIRLVRVPNDSDLKPLGDSLYEALRPPEDDRESKMVQGSIEASNVKPVIEITDMIKISRAYELSNHLLDIESQRMSSAINRLGKV